MYIDTRTRGFSLTDAIRRHVEVRVGAALGPLARRVAAVTARLKDVNAGRGGIDKRCRLVVTLRRLGVVVAEATDADLYAAVGAAAGRARRDGRPALLPHVRRRGTGRGALLRRLRRPARRLRVQSGGEAVLAASIARTRARCSSASGNGLVRMVLMPAA